MSAGGVPMGPIESDPIEVYRGWTLNTMSAESGRLLDEALVGVELGAYDQRIVTWMKRMFDQPTMVTVVSLIERARSQSYGEGYNSGHEDGEDTARH